MGQKGRISNVSPVRAVAMGIGAELDSIESNAGARCLLNAMGIVVSHMLGMPIVSHSCILQQECRGTAGLQGGNSANDIKQRIQQA
jgi:hypothetical protein